MYVARAVIAEWKTHTLLPQAYQFKIQQKQNFIDEMATMIEKLTGQAPKGVAIDETVDDLVWDDELEVFFEFRVSSAA